MAWDYSGLWKLLIDRKLKKTDLFTVAHIHPNTLARMSKNQAVSMDALARICIAFDCKIGGIVEFIPEEDTSSK